MRRLIGWELRKLLAQPVFWGFWLACLGLDLLLAVGDVAPQEKAYLSAVVESYSLTGGRVGPAYSQALGQEPPTPENLRLKEETRDAKDTLQDLSAGELGDFYLAIYRVEGPGQTVLREKYRRFEPALQRLREEGASLSLAAGGLTDGLWGRLFGRLCFALTGQSALLAVLLAFYAGGGDEWNRTIGLLYATRTGRRVQKAKAGASLMAALGAYLAWAVLSLGAFALFWGLGPVWGASVSSQFHTLPVALVRLPFLTWAPFTWGGYLAAVVALGALLTLLFHGLGMAACLFFEDVYRGFSAFLAAAVLNFGALFWAADKGWWLACQLLAFTPLPLWWNQTLWFTEGGPAAALPWQECFSLAACLTLAGALWAAAWRHTKRKDVR